MNVGDAVYVETTSERYAQVQREWNLPKSRRVEATKDFVLECSLMQAIYVGKLADPVVLVRVERKA